MAGAWITLLGAVMTISINYLSIPHFGFMASAWATFFCYGTMMIVSYKWGQKVYPVPYATKKLIAYFIITLILYGIHLIIQSITQNIPLRMGFGTLEIVVFMIFVARVEKKEIKLIMNNSSQ